MEWGLFPKDLLIDTADSTNSGPTRSTIMKGLVSVSYTHLDVYKRQGVGCIRVEPVSLAYKKMRIDCALLAEFLGIEYNKRKMGTI